MWVRLTRWQMVKIPCLVFKCSIPCQVIEVRVGEAYLAQTTTVPGPTLQAASIDQQRRVPTWAITYSKHLFCLFFLSTLQKQQGLYSNVISNFVCDISQGISTSAQHTHVNPILYVYLGKGRVHKKVETYGLFPTPPRIPHPRLGLFARNAKYHNFFLVIFQVNLGNSLYFIRLEKWFLFHLQRHPPSPPHSLAKIPYLHFFVHPTLTLSW